MSEESDFRAATAALMDTEFFQHGTAVLGAMSRKEKKRFFALPPAARQKVFIKAIAERMAKVIADRLINEWIESGTLKAMFESEEESG